MVRSMALPGLVALLWTGLAAGAGPGREVVLRPAAKLKYRDAIELPLPDSALARSKTVYLRWSARIDTGRHKSGSASACQVAVNGLPTSVERLRNKRSYYWFNSQQRVPWYSPTVSAWVFSYYPWERKDVAGGQAHHYVLDITNLLKPRGNVATFESVFGGVPNSVLDVRDVRLLLHDHFARSPLMGKPDPVSESSGLARFRSKALGYHAGAEAKLERRSAYKPQVGPVAPRASFDQPYQLTVGATGRLTVAVAGEQYSSYSWLKLPGEPWRSIGQPGSSGEWDAFSAGPQTVVCEHKKLHVRRTFTRAGSHVEIRDRLTNRTGEALPVVVLNALDVGRAADLTEFRISGRLQGRFWASTSPMEGRQLGATPVLYVAKNTSAMGMVMEDDAYRNQASVLVWDSVLGVGDDMFYLAPRASYTFTWKLFPLAERNYYTLVNAVRHDWGLFQRIPGLFGFVHPTTKQRMYEDVRCRNAQERAAFLASTGIQIASASAVAPYRWQPDRLGTLYGNESLELIRQGIVHFRTWRDEVRAAGAVVRCLPYVDVHLCRVVGKRTLADVEKRLPGCLVRDAFDMPVAYRAGWLYCVLPTLENACGRHLLDLLRLYMDEAKFDGLYLDEWDHSRARVSFCHEDGVSALLDAEGRLMRKVGFVPMLAKPFQMRFVEELTKRSATIFANQFDDTLAAAQLPIVHFAEPGGSYDSYLISAAQVSRTPLSLHVKRRTPGGVWADTKEFLKRGVLLCYYWRYLHGDHVLKRCYPITVRELWPGVVIGDDRIVTCASGTFSLGRRKPLRAYVYTGPKGTLARTADGPGAVALTLGDDEVAVIVEED